MSQQTVDWRLTGEALHCAVRTVSHSHTDFDSHILVLEAQSVCGWRVPYLLPSVLPGRSSRSWSLVRAEQHRSAGAVLR